MSNLDDEDDDDTLGCCTNRSVASITVWPYNNSVSLLQYNITLVDKYIVQRGANSKQASTMEEFFAIKIDKIKI